MIRALISAEMPPLRQPSSTMTRAVRARDGLDDRRVVERTQRAQVDHLGLDALGGELLGGGRALDRVPP